MPELHDTDVDAATIADELSSTKDEPKPMLSIGSGEFDRIDRFTLLEAIGQGGMGELYAAYDAQLDRKVALKLVRADRGNDIADSRLLREAQALAQISHPNVVPVFDVGSAGRRVFVAMEYVRGQTLDAWLEDLDAEGEARTDAILRRFRDAALGLVAVHEAGLAHRDFKPDNVIVGDDGRVRLVDFGLARSTKSTPDTAIETSVRSREDELLAGLELGEMVTPNIEVAKLTTTGALLGTPRYMAPEQWRALRGDSRSDQFSFCVALYHALYGTWPYAGESFDELRTSMLEGSPHEPPREPTISPRLRAALLRGLAREPEERNGDMSEVLDALEDMLAPRTGRQGLLLALLVVALIVAIVKVALPSHPPGGPKFDAMIAELSREAEAQRQWELVADQLASLDAEQAFAEGDQVFEAFAGLADNADTLALARGWLVQAERMGARGLAERERAAIGESLLASPDWGGRHAALLALATIQAAEHEYPRLGATLLVLDDEGGRDEVVDVRVAEAIQRRSLVEALVLLGQPQVRELAAKVEPLVRQLDQVTPTGHRILVRGKQSEALARVPGLDVDEDGQDELILIDHELRAQLLGSGPSLPVLEGVELPFESSAMRWLHPIVRAPSPGPAPAWLALGSPDGRALVELERRSDRVEARVLVDTGLETWVAGDLFSGPGWEGWEAFGSRTLKHMVGLRSLATAPKEFVTEPSLGPLDSYLRAMVIDDLDGDGQQELVVGADGWWAYDVRVLSPASEPGHFDLVARRKLGGNSGMVSFPAPTGEGRWLAVSVPSGPPAPRVFPASAPSGAEPGVYLLAWEGPGSQLELVDRLPLPTSFLPRVGDLDGDGRSELVVELDDSVVILQPGQDLAETALRLSGLRCEAIIDLDGDGDHELIVSEVDTGELLVLGSGDAHLEPLAPPLDPRIPPPPGLEPELRELWARAETLAMVGLLDQSSAAFTKLISLASASSAQSARQRSAELLEREGSSSLAAPLYEVAGDPSSLEHALTIYRDLRQFGDAARVAARLATLPDGPPGRQAEAERLARRAQPRSSIELDLSAPLDENWRIAEPGLLRSEPRGLRIDLLNLPDPVLARRSFEWDGDHLKLDFDLDIERLEWGAMIHVDLVPIDAAGEPEGEPLAGVRVAATGGGGYYVLDRHRDHRLEQGSVNREPRMKAASPADEQGHLHISLDVASDAPSARIVVETSADGSAPSSLAYRPRLRPESRRPGRYELQISAGSELWMRGVVRLQRLGLVGAREDSNAAPLTRRERTLLALTNADHAGALELLGAAEPGEFDPRDADWIAALALEQLGQWSEAQPLLERALGGCEDEQAVARFAYGLLMVPDRFGPPLREFCPAEQFVERTWEVAWGALFHHPDLVDVHRTLTTQLPALDGCEPSTYAQARACADLLTARSRGWYMQNQGAAADTDLRRALGLVETWKERPELDANQRRELLRLGALAHVRLGAVLVIRNLLDEAEVALANALETDQAPEIIADVIVARSLFAPLHDRPIWARVLRAQAGLDQGRPAASE